MEQQTQALGYVRVSTADQAEDGASLDAQETSLRAEAERRGWAIEIVREEGKSAKSITGRPLLIDALRRLDAREADVLLAVRLDRVSRSLTDFAGLMDRAAKKGWSIVLPSSGIDSTEGTTPAARFAAQIHAAAAELERALISARTKEGMMQRKAEGVHLGRPATIDRALYDWIADSRREGWSFGRIASHLNEVGEPTLQGGKQWYPATIKKILESTSGR